MGEELTLKALLETAREEGWDATLTTNVHLDRADLPGTGAVLVEAFNEDGLPCLYQWGSEHEGEVTIAGDKLNERPHAKTVQGVLEWARYTFDAPDDPLPLFGPPAPDGFEEFYSMPTGGEDSEFDRLYRMAEITVQDGIRQVVRSLMAMRDWIDDDGSVTELGRKQLRGDDG